MHPPLIEDDGARSTSSTIVNLALSHRLGPVTLTANVLNLFESKDNDITYFYASRLPGEPTPTHPSQPYCELSNIRYDSVR